MEFLILSLNNKKNHNIIWLFEIKKMHIYMQLIPNFSYNHWFNSPIYYKYITKK